MAKPYIYGVKKQRRPILIKLGLAALVVIIAAAGLTGYKLYRQLDEPSQETATSANKNSAGYVNPYFVFHDLPGWTVDHQSTAHLAIYERHNNGTLTQRFKIYIDTSPDIAEVAASRVLPVRIVNHESLNAGSVSAECKNFLPLSQMTMAIAEVNGVSMPCDPQADNYSVVLAQIGGDYQIKLNHAHSPTNYIFVYYDFRSTPQPDDLIRLINSLKSV